MKWLSEMVFQEAGLRAMKREISWRTTLPTILFIWAVWVSFADAPWYVTPIEMKTRVAVSEAYGIFC